MRIPKQLAERHPLHGPLGSNRLGRSWWAFDEQRSTRVAVTVVSPRHWEVERERLLSGLERLSEAELPLMPQVYDFGRCSTAKGDTVFVVTELVEGRTLRELVDEGLVGPLRARLITAEVAEALEALQDVRLEFGLVDPDRLIVDRDTAEVRMATLPLIGDSHWVPRDGTGQEAMVWSLGALLGFLVRGESPEALDVAQLDGEMREMVTVCLSPDPADRPTLPQLIAALHGDRALNTLTGPRDVDAPVEPPRRGLVAGVLAVGLMGLLCAGWQWVGSSDDAEQTSAAPVEEASTVVADAEPIETAEDAPEPPPEPVIEPEVQPSEVETDAAVVEPEPAAVRPRPRPRPKTRTAPPAGPAATPSPAPEVEEEPVVAEVSEPATEPEPVATTPTAPAPEAATRLVDLDVTVDGSSVLIAGALEGESVRPLGYYVEDDATGTFVIRLAGTRSSLGLDRLPVASSLVGAVRVRDTGDELQLLVDCDALAVGAPTFKSDADRFVLVVPAR